MRQLAKDLLVRKAVVTFNAHTEPHSMDLLQQVGPTRGQIALCIVKVEGDTLTIAQGLYGKDRPSKFDSRDATCSSVTIWKRQHE